MPGFSIGPMPGATAVIGSSSLPPNPTARQIYIVPGTGMFVCLADGSWTQLEQGTTTGEVTGSGITNRLTRWINGTGSVLGDSGVADDGTNVLSLRPFAVGYGLSTPASLLAGPKISAASTISTSPRGILSAQFSTDTAGATVGFQKARGTIGTPTTIVTGDTLGRLMFRGYDGTGYLEMASIESTSTGTIATNRVPTTLTFQTATDASPSVLTTALTLGSDQSATFAGTINGLTITNNGTNTLNIAAGKTVVISNGITFAGTDSTTMTFPSTSQSIPGLGLSNTFTGTTQTISATTPVLKISDTTAGAVPSFLGSSGFFLSIAVNRNPITGTFTDTGKAASQIDMGSQNADASITFYTSATNNAVPTSRMVIAKDGAITMSNLAGTGSRAVLADDNGVLSAPVSDARLKRNIQPLEDVLGVLSNLRGVRFNFIPTEGVHLTKDARPQIGMIADEVENVIPEAVGFNAPVNGTAYRYINYDALIPFLVEALKVLNAKVDALARQVD